MSDTQLDLFQIDSSDIDTNKIIDGSIVDADININANIARSKIHNLDNDLNNRLDRTGGIMTGPLYGLSGISPNDTVTKQQADNELATANSSVSLRVKYPNIYQLVNGSNTITVSGYKILSNTGQQLISNQTTFDLISSNIEGSPSVVFGNQYYLYVTNTGLIFSTTQPNSFKLHPTNHWVYLTTIFTSNITNSIVPFQLINGYYKYTQKQDIIVSLTNTSTSNTQINNIPQTTISLVDLSNFISPASSFVDLGFDGHSDNCGGIQINTSDVVMGSNIQDSRIGRAGCGGSLNGYSNQGANIIDASLLYIDGLTRQIQITSTINANGTLIITLNGFYESWY